MGVDLENFEIIAIRKCQYPISGKSLEKSKFFALQGKKFEKTEISKKAVSVDFAAPTARKHTF